MPTFRTAFIVVLMPGAIEVVIELEVVVVAAAQW